MTEARAKAKRTARPKRAGSKPPPKKVNSTAHVRLKAMLQSRLGRTFVANPAQDLAMDAVVTEAVALNARAIDAVLTEETLSFSLTLQSAAPNVQVVLTDSTVSALKAAFVRAQVLCVIGERPDILQAKPTLPAVPEAARTALDWFARVRSMEDECVRDKDIEGVHELRLALRRTRTALRWLAREVIDPELTQAVLDLRELNEVVGPVRDADVVMALLIKRAPKGVSAEKAKTVVLAARRSQVELMVRYFKSAKLAAKLTSIEHSLRRIRAEWVAPLDVPAVLAGASAERFFRRELRRVRERLQGDLTVDEGYHNVRRQLRRVRDVIDVCGGALKSSQVIWRERLQPVQSLLGAFNDAVTAMEVIRPGGVVVKPTARWLKLRRQQRMTELATPLAVTAALLLNQ